MSKAGVAINGFVAWCREFVGDVYDTSSIMMPREWEEQLDFLEAAAKDNVLNIPDIRTNEDAARVIDELKYRLKPLMVRPHLDFQVAVALNEALNKIITHYKLDGDPHVFASMPKDPDVPDHRAIADAAAVMQQLAFEAGARAFMSDDEIARPFQEKALPQVYEAWMKTPLVSGTVTGRIPSGEPNMASAALGRCTDE